MKTTALILIILASGFAAYAYHQSAEKHPHTSLSPKNNDVKNDFYARLAQENIELKRKISALEQTNQKLIAQAKYQHKPQTPSSTTDNAIAKTDADNAAPPSHLVKETALEFRAYLESLSTVKPGDINNNLTTQFDNEPVDYGWASEHEQKLNAIFSADERLSQFVPEDIQCKTTRCKIKIPLSDYNESNLAMESMANAFANNSVGLEDVMVFTIPDLSAGFVDFYIARNKEIKLYR